MKFTRAYDYSKHKIVQARPLLQWIADDLGELELDLMFHVKFAHPLAQLTAVYKAAEDHQARALVFSNGVHKGHWVITNVEETPQRLADDGSIISIQITVKLQEWTLSAAASQSPKPATPPWAVISGAIAPAVPLAVAPGVPTLGPYTSSIPLGRYLPPSYRVAGASVVTGNFVLPAPRGSYTGIAPGRIVGAP